MSFLWGYACPDCSGTGLIGQDPDPNCNGHGRLLFDVVPLPGEASTQRHCEICGDTKGLSSSNKDGSILGDESYVHPRCLWAFVKDAHGMFNEASYTPP